MPESTKTESAPKEVTGAGRIGWDGDTPYMVLAVDDEGNRTLGEFARVRTDRATLLAEPPKPGEDEG
jgi:hypothetical protein